ncbi:hypothetical protein A0H81_13162 [Grifola frondosa]|uniref:Uncharacterized protein n=1 Tax=Grifola frondosa TaxID=5627 RepID=A0A1C7LQ40_GRIFR|nr:hypothetical protein A0H81_13162 [Grifola frondosa]
MPNFPVALPRQKTQRIMGYNLFWSSTIINSPHLASRSPGKNLVAVSQVQQERYNRCFAVTYRKLFLSITLDAGPARRLYQKKGRHWPIRACAVSAQE